MNDAARVEALEKRIETLEKKLAQRTYWFTVALLFLAFLMFGVYRGLNTVEHMASAALSLAR